MYRIKPFILATLLLAISCLTMQAQVTAEMARTIAINHYWKSAPKAIEFQEIAARLAYTETSSGADHYYAFDINEDAGFVIVSADNSIHPIIGFSFEGSFVVPDEGAPLEYRKILEQKIHFIDSLRDGNVKVFEDIAWKSLADIHYLKSTKGTASQLGPLVETKWGQGTYFNDSLPEYEGDKMLVGCVATAAAQLMKYYEFPAMGSGYAAYESPYYEYKVSADFGNAQYQWDQMPNELTGPNSAVAQLSYHVGVASSMNYSTTASASMNYYAVQALGRHFSYSLNAKQIYSEWYEFDEWKALLRAELDKERPVLFEGNIESGMGHAFLCDGYQDDYFHFNFGWRGAADGYFYLDDINGFNDKKSFYINVIPPDLAIAVDRPLPGLNDTVTLHMLSKEPLVDFLWSLHSGDVMEFVNGTGPESEAPQVIVKQEGSYGVELVGKIGGVTVVASSNIAVGFLSKQKFNNNGVTACGQSCPIKWFDYDNDGDLDIIQCVLGWKHPIKTFLYQNNEGILEKTDIVLPWSYNGSIATFDYDNDGFLDVFIMGPLNECRLYRNRNGQDLDLLDIDFPQLGGGTVIPGDINGDGLMDLFMAGKNHGVSETLLHYYAFLNRGDHFEEIYHSTVETEILYRNDDIAEFADFDNDGDLDIALHEVTVDRLVSGIKILYYNDNTFSPSEYIIEGLARGVITCGDFDHDGDIDIYSVSEKGMAMLYNQGDGFEINTHSTSRYYWARAESNDLNNDGKLDYFTSIRDSASAYFYRGPEFYYPVSTSNTGIIGIDAHLGDYNNDGFMDVALSNEVFQNYLGTNSYGVNDAPSAPSNLLASVEEGSVSFSWDRANDAQAGALGLSYDLVIGTSTERMDIMPAHADLLTGKRKIVKKGNVSLDTSWTINGLPQGNYYWSVQAVDQAYEGSEFALFEEFYISGIRTSKDRVCAGEVVQFTIPSYEDSIGQYEFRWDYGDGVEFVGNSSGPYEVSWEHSGLKTVQVRVIDEDDREHWDSITIEVLSLPILELGNDVSICQSDALELDPGDFSSFLWNTGSSERILSVDTEGIYEVTVRDNNNCKATDSIYISVNPTHLLEQTAQICYGEEYSWEGAVYRESGQYTANYLSQFGCDSIITLDLEVLPLIQTAIEVSICQGEEYMGWSESGEYQKVYTSSRGCDSIVDLTLTVLPTFQTSEEVAICQGEDYLGWTETGEYQKVYTSAGGCDSIVDITLTVLPTFQTSEEVAICQGEDHRGWNISGEYPEVHAAISGCDSIHTTILTVNPLPPTPFISLSADTLYSSSLSGNQWYYNDVIIEGANDHFLVVVDDGDYGCFVSNEFGCSSDFSNTITYEVSSARANDEKGFSIYPTPAIDFLMIRSSLPGNKDIVITSQCGQCLYRTVLLESTHQIDVSSLSPGVYFLTIRSKEIVLTRIIVKL